MATWAEDIILAFENLNGVSGYPELYEEVKKIRNGPLPESWQETIRGTIERNSSDSQAFTGGNDLFYSVEGLGSGIWGLRSYQEYTPKKKEGKEIGKREILLSRIIRDTSLTKDLKRLHNHRCQICGKTVKLQSGLYSEAHHIKPLSKEHNGSDTADNILIVCPNHHVQCDYGAIKLDIDKLIDADKHKINITYIHYHNEYIYQK